MPIANSRHRSNLRAPIVVALLLISGIVGFLILRNGGHVSKPPVAEPVSAVDKPLASAAQGAPMTVASAASVAMPAVSDASRPVRPWPGSLQPAVVAATRVESLAAYQVQVERWSCEGEQCVANLRIPPNVEAGRRGDMSAAAKIFDNLKAEMARADVDVSLESLHPGPQGLAASFVFTPNASIQGRYYTAPEIAAIRLESFEQGRKASGQGRDDRGQSQAR